MQFSTRYGLAAIAALSLLSCVHWIRDQGILLGNPAQWFVGVAPNFAAAIAINFVLLSFWADQKPGTEFDTLRRRFLVCAGVSGGGLTGWELIQMTSTRFVFDLSDLLATLCGILIATLVFYLVTPQRPST